MGYLTVSSVFGVLDTKMIDIACVGDSITVGAGATHDYTDCVSMSYINRGSAFPLQDCEGYALTYPGQLQQLYIDEETWAQVRNWGVGGRMAMKDSEFPYWDEIFYQAAM